jgi:hypothetical protein
VLFLEGDMIDMSGKSHNLNDEGFVIIKNVLNDDEINEYKKLVEEKNMNK